MSDPARYFITTAIDYPNSRPHIGTAFEKLGADVQARYRRMQGLDVFFLMGNDENTVKVSRRAAELGLETKAYCDDMARQFKEVWKALDISFDDFIQTSEPRHHAGCRAFAQKVYDNGYIYKGSYEGLYCEGCEEFKTEKQIKEAGGVCPNHKTPPVLRSEPCYFFALSKFQQQLLDFYEANPDFIQPESRRNEVINFVRKELLDLNLTRSGEPWGIKLPFDPEFTIYVWFDALLNYITAIGYGTDEARFNKWWPADLHVIGKDITRFHCALWPAMLWFAGEKPPNRVFGHGFVHIDNEKMSKTLGNVRDPLGIIEKFKVAADVFRYYFLRECPFPSDGNYSDERFIEVNDGDLSNNLGNLYSRVMTLVGKNYEGRLEGTRGQSPRPVFAEGAASFSSVVRKVQEHIEACQFNQALQNIWQSVLVPTNQYAERREPWKLVKTDRDAARQVLFDMVEPLRAASILLKPFLPRTAETIYRSFNFATPWEQVRYEDAATPQASAEDLRVLASMEGGKVKPLFPRIA